MLIKRFILVVYNFLFPKDSYRRWKLYNDFLWRYFPDPADKIIRDYCLAVGGFSFVQIGVSDGYYLDPLQKFLKRFRCTGLFVEPDSNMLSLVKIRYKKSSSGRYTYKNLAVSDKAGKMNMYYLKPIVKHWRSGHLSRTSSLDRQHVIKHSRWYSGVALSSYIVDCLTFNELMKEQEITQVDLVAIDAEGYDGRIIKSIDFARCQPVFIWYEHHNLSESQRKEVANLLTLQGYSFVEFGMNTLAYKANYLENR